MTVLNVLSTNSIAAAATEYQTVQTGYYRVVATAGDATIAFNDGPAITLIQDQALLLKGARPGSARIVKGTNAATAVAPAAEISFVEVTPTNATNQEAASCETNDENAIVLAAEIPLAEATSMNPTGYEENMEANREDRPAKKRKFADRMEELAINIGIEFEEGLKPSQKIFLLEEEYGVDNELKNLRARIKLSSQVRRKRHA